MPSIPKQTKVLVLGGGPAGSTVATILARNGVDVVLLERAHFPRYHIGESLLPSQLEILDILGVREKIEAHGFVRKPGAHLHWGDEKWSLKFGELSGNHTYSYQVVRSEFDHMLLQHSREQGVAVFEGIRAIAVEFDGERPVRVKWASCDEPNESGVIGFDFLVDATGRDGVMATRYLNSRTNHSVFQNIATWGYWKDIKFPKEAEPGEICVASVEGGWLWGIPLHDGTISVGAVLHKNFVEQTKELGNEGRYHAAIKAAPLFREMLAHATLVSPLKIEKDYSYTSKQFCGPGYFMCGDAACFLDPLLSSGVHLATYSALLAAACLTSVIQEAISETAALRYFEKAYRQAYVRFLVFVSMFYDRTRGQNSYFREAQQLTAVDYRKMDLRSAFLHVVSGIDDVNCAEEGIPSKIMETMKSQIDRNLKMRQNKAALSQDFIATEEVQANIKFFSAIEGFSALSRQDTIDGFFIETKPYVRLVDGNEAALAGVGADADER